MTFVAVNKNEDENIFEAMPERCFGWPMGSYIL